MGKAPEEIKNVPDVFGDQPAHTRTADEVVQTLKSSIKQGLSSSQVTELRGTYGPNQLKAPPKPSLFKITVRNILNAMTFVLSE
jgi:magnesium-transporting ATPase (P-type)